MENEEPKTALQEMNDALKNSLTAEDVGWVDYGPSFNGTPIIVSEHATGAMDMTTLREPGEIKYRSTSINAYHEIEANGLLSRRRWEAYKVLHHFGAMTSAELYEAAQKFYGQRFRDNYQPRLTEMRNLGVVREAGKRKCNVTGHEAIVWECTDDLPKRVDSDDTKKICYILWPTGHRDMKPMVFPTKNKAQEYKLKHEIGGNIHECLWIK